MSFDPPMTSFSLSFSKETPGADALFSEVTGLDSEAAQTELSEGGENRFVHRLPKPMRHANVKFRHGIMVAGCEFDSWIRAILEGDLSKPIEPKTFYVSLLNPENKALMRWSLESAAPVAWSVQPFDGDSGKIAVEKIELSVRTVTRQQISTVPGT